MILITLFCGGMVLYLIRKGKKNNTYTELEKEAEADIDEHSPENLDYKSVRARLKTENESKEL